MDRITSIQIDWYDNGMVWRERIVHQIISVYRNKRIICYRGYNQVSKEPQEQFDVPMETQQCEALFSLFEKAEKMGDFDKDFIGIVCDGSEWEMRLRHSDNRINLFKGTIEYPAHGKEIEHYIKSTVDNAHLLNDPMIFGCFDD